MNEVRATKKAMRATKKVLARLNDLVSSFPMIGEVTDMRLDFERAKYSLNRLFCRLSDASRVREDDE